MIVSVSTLLLPSAPVTSGKPTKFLSLLRRRSSQKDDFMPTLVICCQSRSGSSVLADMLTKNGIGNLTRPSAGWQPGELLHPHFSRVIGRELSPQEKTDV